MAHLHSVYDTDTHFSIDPITRAIKNESSKKIKVMQFDHNSERFTFDLPRMIEEHDMSLCNRVEVHFENGATKDVYEVKDLGLSPAADDVVICSWLISQNCTQNAAALNFRLTFKCVAEDGTLDYSWSTEMHRGISVSGGANNSAMIVERYSDVLEQWRQRIEGKLEDIQNVQSYYDAETQTLYIIGGSAPSIGCTHEHTSYEYFACGGGEHKRMKKCDVCGILFDAIAEKCTYMYGDAERNGDGTHQRELTCVHCGSIVFETEKCFDLDSDGRCDVCRYIMDE